jgi:hypothetical protein
MVVMKDGLLLVVHLVGEFPKSQGCCFVTVVVTVQSKR